MFILTIIVAYVYVLNYNDIVFVVETVVGDSGEVSAHPACYEHEYRWSSKSCLRADGHQGLLLLFYAFSSNVQLRE